MKVVQYFSILAVICSCFLACNKADFLDDKPRSDMFVPGTLDEFQLLLDNDIVTSETPHLGEVSSDNYVTTDAYFQLLTPKERNAYAWEPEIYDGEEGIADWNYPYQQVFTANVVLDGLDKLVSEKGTKTWRKIRGSALFIRGYAFYNVSQLFAPAYNEVTATADLGIPLRVTPNVDEKSQRSSVEETYRQILADLTEASELLTDSFPATNRNRPWQMAAFAELARVYLSMRKYDKALLYADSCLMKYSSLIDYTQLNTTVRSPFDRQNAETMYQTRIYSRTNLIKSIANCIVDTALYRSYSDNDLRKSVYFLINSNNFPTPKGSYYGNTQAFSGLATDEMYLIRAECYARAGETAKAMGDLNTLLRTRWKTGTFVPFTAQSSTEALSIILRERRKELLFRGLRWSDLRRLNLEGANIKLTRRVGSELRELLPNSKLYVLPIPPDVIRLSGMQNNER